MNKTFLFSIFHQANYKVAFKKQPLRKVRLGESELFICRQLGLQQYVKEYLAELFWKLLLNTTHDDILIFTRTWALLEPVLYGLSTGRYCWPLNRWEQNKEKLSLRHFIVNFNNLKNFYLYQPLRKNFRIFQVHTSVFLPFFFFFPTFLFPSAAFPSLHLVTSPPQKN